MNDTEIMLEAEKQGVKSYGDSVPDGV